MKLYPGSAVAPAALAPVALALIAALNASAHADVTQYGDRSQFNAAVFSQSFESFEEAHQSPGTFTAPLKTNETIYDTAKTLIFFPGDFVSGLTIDEDITDTNGMHIQPAYNEQSLAPNNILILDYPDGGAHMTLAFDASQSITNLAFDLYEFQSTAPMTVNVYGTAGLISTSSVSISHTAITFNDPTFFGITTTAPITRVTIASGNFTVSAPGIDNIAFATTAPKAPAVSPLKYVSTPTAYTAGSRNPTTETFDQALVTNTNFRGPISHLANAIDANGQTISKSNDFAPGISFTDDQGSPYGLRIVSRNGSNCLEDPSGEDPLIINLTADGVTALSFDLYNGGPTGTPALPVILSIYGKDGVFLGTESVYGYNSTPTFVGILSPNGDEIKEVRFSQVDTDLALDNVSYSTALPTPEPASLTTLAAASLLLLRRRRCD